MIFKIAMLNLSLNEITFAEKDNGGVTGNVICVEIDKNFIRLAPNAGPEYKTIVQFWPQGVVVDEDEGFIWDSENNKWYDKHQEEVSCPDEWIHSFWSLVAHGKFVLKKMENREFMI